MDGSVPLQQTPLAVRRTDRWRGPLTASQIPFEPGAFTAPVVDYEPPPIGVAAAPPLDVAGVSVPRRRRLPRCTGHRGGCCGPSSGCRAEVAPPPAAATFADAALRRVLEVIDRRRPIAQLRPMLTPPLLDMVFALARTAGTRQGGGAAASAAAHRRRRRARPHEPSAAEVFATYTRGPRVRAIAGRIEVTGGALAHGGPCRSDNEPVQGDTVSVERVIKAPAREIFALLADAGRHCQLRRFGDGGPRRRRTSIPLELGTKFSMRMRGRPETLFMPYTMSNKVIEFEPDRRIAWQSTHLRRPGRRAHLALRTHPDHRRHAGPRDVGRVQGPAASDAEDGLDAAPGRGRMRATLARIAALVEN